MGICGENRKKWKLYQNYQNCERAFVTRMATEEAGGRAMNGSSGGARKGASSGHGAHRTQNGNASSNAAASKKFSSKFSSKLASSSLTPSSAYFESTWSNASGFAVGKGLGGRCKGKFGLGAHFIFKKVLGEGSEGQTWACEEVATRRLVAVKVIARHSDEPRLRKNSLRETLERNLYLKRRSGAEREGPRAEANDKKKKKAKKFNPGRVAAEIIMQVRKSRHAESRAPPPPPHTHTNLEQK